MNFITASTKIILIGIIGASNTGKTTFLTLLYCLLRHGEKIGDYSFAGSYTLTGWENISWYLRWKNHASIQFPPHTSINAGRTPGLLHLALKNEKGEEKNLIFTDAPGEWFDHWRINSNDEAASGARWVYENSSAFLLFADSEQLSGEKRGTAKFQVNTIADRIIEKLSTRPLALIWSKSDKDIKETTKEQILSHIKLNGLINFKDFRVSIYEGENQEFHKNICQSLEWILSCKEKNINNLPSIKSFKPEDIFLSKRNING